MNNSIYKIANKVKLHGGNVYLVGGAIRDSILGISNHDEDYCVTEYHLMNLKKYFQKLLLEEKIFLFLI